MDLLKRDHDILYLIASLEAGEDRINEALKAGVDVIQLREKGISSAEYLKRARLIRRMASLYDVTFIINDRVDIAVLSDADGVHLGQSDLPVSEARKLMGEHRLIGATARTPKEAQKAQADGADYIGSGAWFSTRTKSDAVFLSRETYGKIRRSLVIPSLAVGGITAENCREPIAMGADGVAVSAGLLGESDIQNAVLLFRANMQQ